MADQTPSLRMWICYCSLLKRGVECSGLLSMKLDGWNHRKGVYSFSALELNIEVRRGETTYQKFDSSIV